MIFPPIIERSLFPPRTERSIHLSTLSTLRPIKNGRHFADDTFKRIFLNEYARVLLKISLKFVPKGPMNNVPALVQIMAWRQPGNKSSSEAMLVRLPTHIWVTRTQWVKKDILDCKIFRPVSNRSFISKIIECIVSVQLSDHQKTHDLYEVSHQVSVYRQLHSAEAALFCYLVDNDLLQAGNTPVGATLVLSATFDTIRHHGANHKPES